MSKIPRFPPAARAVAVVVFDGFQLLDAAGPIAAFEIAEHFAPGSYKVEVAAVSAGSIASSSGVRWPARVLGRLRSLDTLMVMGGQGTRAAMQDKKLVSLLKRKSALARRTASVCSGAFLLAQAGLLAGKRATTHWRHAGDLARLFPDVRVEPDRIHIRDGNVWTSAGVTAGIDLALAMIGDDLGDAIANKVAREMVVYAKRPGGQAQHSALLTLDVGGSRFAALNAWIAETLAVDLSVERLAERAGMSARNFARAYAAETGTTPAKAVERIRADAARAMIEQGASLQTIASRTGFNDPERMRRAFVRHYGAPPAAMRRTLRRP